VAYLSTPQNTSTNIVGIYDINHNLVFSVPSSVTHQNVSTTSPSSDGFGWSPTFEVPLPNDLKSGIYLIENRFPFVVKSTIPTDIVVVFPFNTENAYNESGGKSLYSHADRPFQVSFLRPISIPNKAPVLDFVEDGLQWFTTQTDFSIGYITDQDLDNYDYLQNSKLLILTGHSEYWTRTARENFDKFIDNNGDALILSGNVMWWQVRYSDDKSKLICYKDLPDPVADPLLKTIKWTEPSLNYPITLSIGADYAHGGYGYKADQGWDGYKIVSPNSPLLQGTGLKKGDIIKLPTIEYDGAVLKGMDRSGYPILDETHYNFFKMEIIGFDRGSSSSGETIATFLAFQRTPTSGKVVHTATTNWCSYEGIGGTDQNVIRLITKNAITKLLQDQNIFSY
jgi:hypothetical protein